MSHVTEEYMLYGILSALSNRIQAMGDRQFSEVTMKQHLLLIALNFLEKDCCSLKEAAEKIGCSYQNVKRMAESLEKKGYLEMRRGSRDKRRTDLRLTEEGRLLIGRIKENAIGFMEKMYRDIPRDDIKITLHVLEKMDSNLKIE